MNGKNPAGEPSPKGTLSNRLASLDAYRGLVMLLMMGEVLEFKHVARRLPDSSWWSFLAYHQSHIEWVGCTLHDLIQPSFTFLVGVALPFSLLRRTAEGQPAWLRTLHAFWRAAVLVLLGVWLRSLNHAQTYWTFEDTLSQIGLGYGFLYLLGGRSVRVQVAALGLLLVGYWLAFALYPLPGTDFDWARAGVAADWPHHLGGFAAHWNKNTNPAWAFDNWLLNLFPREHVFTNNPGGYATLSFIPTLATMILGLLGGGVLCRSDRTARQKLRWLVIAGVTCLAAGWLLGALGICPVVKRIWTPSWVLFSGGWCFLFLAAFYGIVDLRGGRAWAFPLIVIGMNSIAAYFIADAFRDFIHQDLVRHLGAQTFQVAGTAYEPLLVGSAVLAIQWLVLLWMYRRRLFLRV